MNFFISIFTFRFPKLQFCVSVNIYSFYVSISVFRFLRFASTTPTLHFCYYLLCMYLAFSDFCFQNFNYAFLLIIIVFRFRFLRFGFAFFLLRFKLNLFLLLAENKLFNYTFQRFRLAIPHKIPTNFPQHLFSTC